MSDSKKSEDKKSPAPGDYVKSGSKGEKGGAKEKPSKGK